MSLCKILIPSKLNENGIVFLLVDPCKSSTQDLYRGSSLDLGEVHLFMSA